MLCPPETYQPQFQRFGSPEPLERNVRSHPTNSLSSCMKPMQFQQKQCRMNLAWLLPSIYPSLPTYNIHSVRVIESDGQKFVCSTHHPHQVFFFYVCCSVLYCLKSMCVVHGYTFYQCNGKVAGGRVNWTNYATERRGSGIEKTNETSPVMGSRRNAARRATKGKAHYITSHHRIPSLHITSNSNRCVCECVWVCLPDVYVCVCVLNALRCASTVDRK